MVLELIEMLEEKVEESKILTVVTNNEVGHMMAAIIPTGLTVDEDGIYIESDDLTLSFINEKGYQTSFDYDEDEFIIKQGQTTFYLS